MVIKTAIALVLTASLAGGAVYYGTQEGADQNGEVMLEEHPHRDIQVEEQFPAEDVTVETEKNMAEVQSEPDNRSKIYQLLNKEPDSSEDNQEADETSNETIEANVENVSEGADTEEAQIKEELIRDEEKEVAQSMPSFEDEIVRNTRAPNELFDFAIGQAKRIETVDIRDQAYLDIIDYACSQNDYDRAQSTLSKIDKAQARDKARRRIAISMAQRGLSANAFAIVDSVETEGLRDTMRLQVLQAMIQN